MEQVRAKGAIYLFESVRKHKYTDRGVRKMLARYAAQAGITRSMSPHKWRHVVGQRLPVFVPWYGYGAQFALREDALLWGS
jgi:site-specific recombinase XerC